MIQTARQLQERYNILVDEFKIRTSRNWNYWNVTENGEISGAGDNDQVCSWFRGASFGSFKLFHLGWISARIDAVSCFAYRELSIDAEYSAGGAGDRTERTVRNLKKILN